MRHGLFDGTVQEFRDLVETAGGNPLDYLEKPKSPLANWCLIIPIIGCLVGIALLWALPEATGLAVTFFILIATVFAGWLAVAVQIRFQSTTVTIVLAIATILVIAFAARATTLAEAIETLKSMKKGE